eukprot:SAG22_NODE_757_length_7441_cov_29.224326_2_plen_108_part_00
MDSAAGRPTSSPPRPSWGWGPSGELTSLPANFSHRTLVVFGSQGVTDAFERMGKVLQALHWVPAPADARKFFRELMRQGLKNGMGKTFEIDFLWFQFLQMPRLMRAS